MSLREVVTQAHVVMSCTTLLASLIAVFARHPRWRRYHYSAGRIAVITSLSAGVLGFTLAVDSSNTFGALFMASATLVTISGWLSMRASVAVWARIALGLCSSAVGLGVLRGFLRFLERREWPDVISFAAVGIAVLACGLADLRAAKNRKGRDPRGHARRMLVATWMYLSELVIFVFDPHPSSIAWLLSGCALVALGALVRSVDPSMRAKSPRSLPGDQP